MKEMICITCPRGCHLLVEEEEPYSVSGNSCDRGAVYGRNEVLRPQRVITSTVVVFGTDGKEGRLPIKTDAPIDKALIFPLMHLISSISVHAPIHTGDILLADVLGSGVNLVATTDKP